MTAGIQGLPQLIQSRYGNPIPLVSIAITDTAVHSYLTNPTQIGIVKFGTSMPIVRSYALWVYNQENQPVTVTPITNIVNDGSYPDIPMTGTQFSVAAGSGESGSAGWAVFPFENYSVEYFSIQLSFSTAPTSGTVTANLYIYYGD